MGSSQCEQVRVNLFALVVYIPDPLARFLDDLRKELVPGCIPRAHVTVLPPRPLAVDPQAASDEARRTASGFAPFDLELGRIEIFEATDVIYVGLTRGVRELKEMHDGTNGGALAFNEPFAYHPHVTLAQGLEHDRLDSLYRVAARRWAEFPHTMRFRAERVTFVQSTDCVRWADLAEISLDGVPAR
jgi:2'-5' RNA ligase